MQDWSVRGQEGPSGPPPGGAPRPVAPMVPPSMRPAAPPPGAVNAPPWAVPPAGPPTGQRQGPAGPPPPHARLAWQPAPPEPGPTFAAKVGIAAIVITIFGALAIVTAALATRSATVAQDPPPATPSPPVASPTPSSASPQPSITRTWSPSPQPVSTPPTTPSVTVAPDPGPRAWELPARQWEALPAPQPTSPLFAAQQTSIDELPPVTLTGCPDPVVVKSEKQWRADVRAQWSCVHAAWVPVFQQLGWSTEEPEVRFFPGSGSKSACGYLEAPAFYCADGPGVVYFGAGHLEMAQQWDLSVNEMVNHEYGHHLQRLAGITRVKMDLGGREVERRAELQATCWSGMMTYHNRSFPFDGRDLDSWNQRLATMLEDGVHGTRESMTYWGTRGLYAQTLGDCNTWVVDDAMVK